MATETTCTTTDNSQTEGPSKRQVSESNSKEKNHVELN